MYLFVVYYIIDMISFNNKNYLTVDEAAKKLGYSKQNIYNMIKIGKFRTILQIRGNRKLVEENEVNDICSDMIILETKPIKIEPIKSEPVKTEQDPFEGFF